MTTYRYKTIACNIIDDFPSSAQVYTFLKHEHFAMTIKMLHSSNNLSHVNAKTHSKQAKAMLKLLPLLEL